MYHCGNLTVQVCKCVCDLAKLVIHRIELRMLKMAPTLLDIQVGFSTKLAEI